MATLALILALGFTTASAQEKSKLPAADRLVIDLFSDIWQNIPKDDLKPAAINRGIAFSMMFDKPLGYSNFSLGIGIGYSGHNLYSSSKLTIIPDLNANPVFAFSKIPDGIDYKTNKININYIEIPFEIRFRTKNTSEKFRIHIGGKIGYLINAHTKYKGEESLGFNDNSTVKIHFTNSEEVNSLRYGIQARIGYSDYNLFAYYALNPLFKEGKGPEMFPISVGLSYTPF